MGRPFFAHPKLLNRTGKQEGTRTSRLGWASCQLGLAADGAAGGSASLAARSSRPLRETCSGMFPLILTTLNN